MNSRKILNRLYRQSGWTNGPTTRERELLTTMDFFSQNVLLSGDRGTGKSTTVCIGLLLILVARNHEANVINNNDDSNGGGEFRSGFNNGSQYNNLDAEAAEISFRFVTRDSDRGNHEDNGSLAVIPINRNHDNTNFSGLFRALIPYISNAANRSHQNHDLIAPLAVIVGNNNHDNASDIENNIRNSSDSYNRRDDDCETKDVFEVQYRNGRAFAFIVAYKTKTCIDPSSYLRYLVPNMRVLTLTGSINWATNFESICRAYILVISFDHLEIFYRTSWAIYFPDLKFYIVEEAISMSHRRHMDTLEYFLQNYTDRSAI
uniref:Helicase ATP-binding domain-containing protein n=1 Tax=Strongyloides venezuelensis TaxID=75913 RepID=A0A0K0FRZ0_STRVS